MIKRRSGRMDTLNVLINKRLDFIKDGIKVFQTNGFVITDSMRVNREPSKMAMDSIRLYIRIMKETEERLIIKRRNEVSDFFTSTSIIMLSSVIITLVTFFYSLIVYNRENRPSGPR
jgi:CHASE3 domain sensor protein